MDALQQPDIAADVNAGNADGLAELMTDLDADPEDAETVERRLAAGAPISDPADAHSSPPLEYAAKYLSEAVMDCIIEHRADQLTAPMLAKAAAVAATEAEIETEQDRIKQLGTVVKLVAATMAAAPDADTAAAALLEAFGVQHWGLKTEQYGIAAILRASLHGWAQAAARADGLESQRIAVQQWMVIVAQDHLRLVAVQEQLREREEHVNLREQQGAARE